MGFKHRLHQALGGSLAALALSVAPAWAEELQDWSFDTSRSELTFSLSDQVLPEFFLLSEPPRLVLDIPNTEIGDINPEQFYGGAVQAIRVAQHTPDHVRVVIELSPDIVLSPEQADIQFDDGGDGQRSWHFRPLIAEADDSVTATTAAAPAAPIRPSNGADPDISLSAANLKLPVERPNSTALPIDPYDDGASSNAVVSVPPLASDEAVVRVPPLADVSDSAGNAAPISITPALSNDASTSVVAAVEVPELPPMIVPELEATEASNDTAIPATVDTNPRQENLPELDARLVNPQPDSPAVTEPIDSELLPITESATVEVILPAENEPAAADVVITEPEVTAAAVAEQEVPTAETPVEEPVPNGDLRIGEDDQSVETPTPEVSTPAVETALAPVESLRLPEKTPAAVADSSPTPQPIQQPAAERTITQTEVPSPLPFGQPLPTER